MEGEPIMQFFAYAHLPEKLQAVSQPFGVLAEGIVATLPRNAERTVRTLEALDQQITACVKRVPSAKRKIVTTHDAPTDSTRLSQVATAATRANSEMRSPAWPYG